MIRSSVRLAALTAGLAVGLALAAPVQAQRKVRFAYPSSADMGDVPSLLAWSSSRNGASKWCRRFFREPIWPFKRWSPAKPISVPPPASRSSRRSKAA